MVPLRKEICNLRHSVHLCHPVAPQAELQGWQLIRPHTSEIELSLYRPGVWNTFQTYEPCPYLLRIVSTTGGVPLWQLIRPDESGIALKLYRLGFWNTFQTYESLLHLLCIVRTRRSSGLTAHETTWKWNTIINIQTRILKHVSILRTVPSFTTHLEPHRWGFDSS